MANTLTYVENYILNILDAVYKEASKSAVLDLDSALVRDVENMPGYIQIPEIVFDSGLADYNKTTGAVQGDVQFTWQLFKLTKDRAKQFVLDAVDNIETAGIVLANMASEFLRLFVIPEIDAYRFSVYATNAKTKVEATLTETTIEASIATALTTLKEAEIPTDRLALFMNPNSYSLLKSSVKANRLITGSDVKLGIANYDGLPVFEVPSSRFNSTVTLTSTGGYSLDGQTINFLLMDRAAAAQAVKHVANKLFTPDQNINTDGYLWRYRVYHDAFVPKNKTSGIYAHTVPSSDSGEEEST